MQTGPANEESEQHLSNRSDKGQEQAPLSRFFHKRLISANNLDEDGFQEWLLHPAMLFGSNHKWWGDLGKRDALHEGLDLCFYRTGEGTIHRLHEQTKIPVLFKGWVVEVCDDFLGKSVFVRHYSHNLNDNTLYTIYGHLKPYDHIRPNEELNEGDIIGTLANTEKNDGSIPYHLHISVAWIPNTLRSQKPGWEMMSDPEKVTLIDPLHVIECPHSVLSDI